MTIGDRIVGELDVDAIAYACVRQEQELREAFADDEIPYLANGFSFVIHHQADTHADIPADEFTGIFADRGIPIAAADNHWRRHDVGHAVIYREIVSHQEFADLIPIAAQNSLAEEQSGVSFASAIDEFGETVDSLYRGNLTVLLFKQARDSLWALIALRASGDAEADAQLFDRLYKALRIDQFERYLVGPYTRTLADSLVEPTPN